MLSALMSNSTVRRGWNLYGIYIIFAGAILGLLAFLSRLSIGDAARDIVSDRIAGASTVSPREAAANSTLGVSDH